jgi:hypothetical protein
MRATRAASLAVLALLSLAASAAAQVVPRVMIGDMQCVPKRQHQVAFAVAGPLEPGDQVRIYFRRSGYGDFYWVPAHPTSEGTYWGVLPVPEPDNQMAEIYAAVVKPPGAPRAQSRVIQVPVQDDCRVPQLHTAQQAEAGHLTVGETTLGQKGRKVAWWQCEGVRERVDVLGQQRADDMCLPLAWWQRPQSILPVMILSSVGIVTVVNETPPTPNPNGLTPTPLDVSPSNP